MASLLYLLPVILGDGTFAQATIKLLRNDLIIVDELGYVQFDTTGSGHPLQLIVTAHGNKSLIVTSSLDFQGWGRLLANRRRQLPFGIRCFITPM